MTKHELELNARYQAEHRARKAARQQQEADRLAQLEALNARLGYPEGQPLRQDGQGSPVVPRPQTASPATFFSKIGPILKGLQEQGRRNMATISPGSVARLAFDLERLIEDWHTTNQTPLPAYVKPYVRPTPMGRENKGRGRGRTKDPIFQKAVAEGAKYGISRSTMVRARAKLRAEGRIK